MLNVPGSMSTSTGLAPTRTTQPAVAKNEYVGVITSSPGPMSSAIRAASTASVPDDRPMACGTSRLLAQLALEAFDFRTADETLAVADPRDGVENGLAKRRVLCLEVEQRNCHKLSMVHAPGGTRKSAARAATRSVGPPDDDVHLAPEARHAPARPIELVGQRRRRTRDNEAVGLHLIAAKRCRLPEYAPCHAGRRPRASACGTANTLVDRTGRSPARPVAPPPVDSVQRAPA